MGQIAPLEKCHGLIVAMEPQFRSVSVDDRITFQREAEFAIQHLQNNSYTATVALENPASLQNAVVNTSALGISLNPAQKHAYLVPRKIDGRRSVCLDISYMGLIHVALDSGAVEWVQAKLVYKGDKYQSNGLTDMPTHAYKPFTKNRTGQDGFVGVYVVAKLASGEYLTHEMDADSVLAIMNRSESVKAGKASPWKTDFGEMAKKTCVKQAQKYWPKNGRIAALVAHLDNSGEGIDFDAERRGQAPDPAAIEAAEAAAEEFIQEARTIATATKSEAMADSWAGLSARLKKAVLNGQAEKETFDACKKIISDRVQELKDQAARDEARTVDTEAKEIHQ